MDSYTEICMRLGRIEYGIASGEAGVVSGQAEQIISGNFIAEVSTAEEIQEIFDRIYDLLTASYRKSMTGVYLPLFNLFIRITTQKATDVDLIDRYIQLFAMTAKFSAIYYQKTVETGPCVLKFEDEYTYQIKCLKKLVQSDLFMDIVSKIRDHHRIFSCFEDMTVDLMNFLVNKRSRLFVELYDFLLMTLSSFPAYLPSFTCLFRITELLPETYIFSEKNCYDKLKQSVMKFYRQLEHSSIAHNVKSLIEIVFDSKKEGDDESALTREDVMRFAFEEICVGEAMNEDEQRLLDDLQHHLEISEDLFRTLRIEVVSKLNRAHAHSNRRNFSPKAFLEKVMGKVIEDGIIDDNEKHLMMKLFNALKVDRELFHKALEKASIIQKKKLEESQNKELLIRKLYRELPDINGRLQSKFHHLIRSCGLEKIMENVLKQSTIINFAFDPNSRISVYRNIINTSRDRVPHVIDFIYDNKVSELPAILFFCRQEHKEIILSQLKGNDFSFIIDKQASDLPRLLIFNECLQKNVDIQGQIMTDLLDEFKAGLESGGGRFIFSVIEIESLKTLFAAYCEGTVDLSGVFSETLTCLDQGETARALEVISSIHEGEKRQRGLYRLKGLCYKMLADQDVEPDKNYQTAIDNFKIELQHFPYSSACLNNLSHLYQKLDRWSEAAETIDVSLNKAPVSIDTLLNAPYLFLQRAINHVMKESDAEETETADPTIIDPLIRAMQIDPENDRIMKCYNEISDISEELRKKGISVKIGDLEEEAFKMRTDTLFH